MTFIQSNDLFSLFVFHMFFDRFYILLFLFGFLHYLFYFKMIGTEHRQQAKLFFICLLISIVCGSRVDSDLLFSYDFKRADCLTGQIHPIERVINSSFGAIQVVSSEHCSPNYGLRAYLSNQAYAAHSLLSIEPMMQYLKESEQFTMEWWFCNSFITYQSYRVFSFSLPDDIYSSTSSALYHQIESTALKFVYPINSMNQVIYALLLDTETVNYASMKHIVFTYNKSTSSRIQVHTIHLFSISRSMSMEN